MAAGIAACALTAALLVLTDGPDDAREVADEVVAALSEGDSDAYTSLRCAGAPDPVPGMPPVLAKKTLTVTLEGLRYYPGEGRPNGQIEHYRATAAVRDPDIDVVLLIKEEDGSWCLSLALACPDAVGDPPAVHPYCRDKPGYGEGLGDG